MATCVEILNIIAFGILIFINLINLILAGLAVKETAWQYDKIHDLTSAGGSILG